MTVTNTPLPVLGEEYEISAKLSGTHKSAVFLGSDHYSGKIFKVGPHVLTLKHELDVTSKLLLDPEIASALEPYLPQITDHFTFHPKSKDKEGHKDEEEVSAHPMAGRKRGKRRSNRTIQTFGVNVMDYDPEMVVFTDVCRRFPGGADVKETSWMLRRMLLALGLMHSQGIIHGNILPDHLLVHGPDRGIRFLDWSVAGDGSPLPVTNKRWEMMYAPEALAKEELTPSTDIYMAVRCWQLLIRDQPMPIVIKAFLNRATSEDVTRRSQDALELLEEFTAICTSVYGKLTFSPFDIPAQLAPSPNEFGPLPVEEVEQAQTQEHGEDAEMDIGVDVEEDQKLEGALPEHTGNDISDAEGRNDIEEDIAENNTGIEDTENNSTTKEL